MCVYVGMCECVCVSSYVLMLDPNYSAGSEGPYGMIMLKSVLVIFLQTAHLRPISTTYILSVPCPICSSYRNNN